MKVYILKWTGFDESAMFIVAANNEEELLDVLRESINWFMFFNPDDEHLKRIEDRRKWRFMDRNWDMYECPTLTANVDKPQIIDEL